MAEASEPQNYAFASVDVESLVLEVVSYLQRLARDPGAGLGLSICREIATVHGWDLRAKRAEPGMIFDLVPSGHLSL